MDLSESRERILRRTAQQVAASTIAQYDQEPFTVSPSPATYLRGRTLDIVYAVEIKDVIVIGRSVRSTTESEGSFHADGPRSRRRLSISSLSVTKSACRVGCRTFTEGGDKGDKRRQEPATWRSQMVCGIGFALHVDPLIAIAPRARTAWLLSERGFFSDGFGASRFSEFRM
jgi:hypothetical protein